MVQRGTRRPIGEILVEGAFVKANELQVALQEARAANKKVGQVLVDKGLITPETLATVLSFQMSVPIVDLKQFKIQPEALEKIPEDVARRYNAIPLAIDGDTLTVAVEEPHNLELMDMLTSISRMRIKPVIPLHGGIREAISVNYRMTAKLKEEISQVMTQQPGAGPAAAGVTPPPGAGGRGGEPVLMAEAVSHAPVVKAVDTIVAQAVKDRASDIHIEPQEDGLRIRYRVDGILHDMVTLPMGVHSALISRLKVLAGMNIAERRRPQDGQITMKVAGRDIDLRVATIETLHGEMMVLRILDKSMNLLHLAQTGVRDQQLDVMKRVLRSAYGMVMISGPTGAGKTTTLYACVNELDPNESNIMTIEDPIEYRFKKINQVQVNTQADITFAKGLRATLRLDPDIILVGEIRDSETANVAVQAALTGHLVLTSIHANDAVGALVRIMDLGVEPFLVTSAVVATVSQRLVRKVCPYCKAIRAASPDEAMAYQHEMSEVRTDFTYGRGCNFCGQTGYMGRVGVFEMLPITEQIRQLVAKGASASEIRAQALREGMITMRRDGMLKARDGITTPSEVLRNVFAIT
ncbi:MAG: ATPase, T2SS/T4P/T4SS family [Dehalococcoidia bacterium]|nr:ATPase, T2SS/T4P/T4SS family [Dehalococcoidia bacterium]